LLLFIVSLSIAHSLCLLSLLLHVALRFQIHSLFRREKCCENSKTERASAGSCARERSKVKASFSHGAWCCVPEMKAPLSLSLSSLARSSLRSFSPRTLPIEMYEEEKSFKSEMCFLNRDRGRERDETRPDEKSFLSTFFSHRVLMACRSLVIESIVVRTTERESEKAR
jgi:hypothetical protein